jgi:hypothetical protein
LTSRGLEAAAANLQPGFRFADLPPGSASCALVFHAMEGKVVDKAAYVGRFRRAR